MRNSGFVCRLLFLLSFVVSTWDACSQTDSPVPVVTIQATEPTAFNSTNPGVFTVFRQNSTNETLNIYYTIGGTASNGVDYAQIGNFVEIPAGAISNTIVVTPTGKTPTGATKTVILQLSPSPLLNPVNYEIGNPSNATVFIESSAPGMTITFPGNGALFYTPTNIEIEASANFGYGQPPTNVEFFAGSNDLGGGTIAPPAGPGPTPNIVSPYLWYFVWTNPPPADYPLTTVGAFASGISVTSAPVNVTVLQGTQTNLPPTVSFVEPQNGQTFFTPTNIQLAAKASDPDGSVTNVEFFAGSNDLGPGMPVVLDPPGINGITGLIYILAWQNPSAGNYSLTAVATDNGGASTVSTAVGISVLDGSPSNPPPVVRIVSPANGSVFHAPIDLPLFAYVNYPTDSTASVEFYDGTTDLGAAQPLLPPTPVSLTAPAGAPDSNPVAAPPIYPTNLFYLVWSNAPAGNHVLTAQATVVFNDRPLVLVSKSAPVNITILPAVPPPTNRPAIVSIVATDPVAVEGTNTWVWPGETNSPPTWAAWPAAIYRSFTNCGPKTATFAVRRLGETNDNLTVTYSIGGTASNGVDYVALAGFVTVPAAERAALITIVPIDDGPPDINKTVVLSVNPSTNAPPDYLVGFPSRAAAIIIDHPGVRPASVALPGKCFDFRIPGPDAAWYAIEYSTNLRDWTVICTNQVVNGSIDFIDPDASASPGRFYRAVPVMNPPAE